MNFTAINTALRFSSSWMHIGMHPKRHSVYYRTPAHKQHGRTNVATQPKADRERKQRVKPTKHFPLFAVEPEAMYVVLSLVRSS